MKNVYGEVKAMPAYAMLMPGFPSSSTKGELNEYQNYDCDLAKEHLATAGFADGAGFPKQGNSGCAMKMWPYRPFFKRLPLPLPSV